jgi:hypothetical protein
MKKEFVSYEMALALKELGFDESCFYQYVRDYDECGELIPIVSETNYPILRNNTEVSDFSGGDCFAAPTFSQAFRFFREKFNWQASIEATKDQHSHELGYNYFIWNSETGLEYHTMPMNKPSGDWEFKTYEEAEIACLLKLIEIIKNENNE